MTPELRVRVVWKRASIDIASDMLALGLVRHAVDRKIHGQMSRAGSPGSDQVDLVLNSTRRQNMKPKNTKLIESIELNRTFDYSLNLTTHVKLSTLAFKSLLKVSNFFCVFFLMEESLEKKIANSPEKSSDCTNVVPPGVVVLGSKRNECFPIRRP